ncbi:hypothetical protein [Moritella viscosa]|uniref:hypothetical protein n=1 Tax=Moritella viscosa TaxID=80854 RepID=UPI001C316306|nr:hypothetical protein [Moritella viscosa]
MSIEDDMIERRNVAQASGEQVVPDSYQGVSKQRVREVLAEIDQSNDNKIDVVYSLLCDEHSCIQKQQDKNFVSVMVLLLLISVLT